MCNLYCVIHGSVCPEKIYMRKNYGRMFVYENLEICMAEDRGNCGWCKEPKLAEALMCLGLSPTPSAFMQLKELCFCKIRFYHDTNWYEVSNSKSQVC